MLKKSSGFTLIELLVVVLIIGILAAIALPQYERAVKKARIANVLPAIRAIYNAQKVYFLEHGAYAEDMEDLVLEVPCPQDWTCVINNDVNGTATGQPKVEIGRVGYPTLVLYYGNYARFNTNMEGKLYCAAQTANNAQNVRLCQSFGGPLLSTESGYTRYLL